MNWIKRENHNENSGIEKNYSFPRWVSCLFLAVSILLLIYTYYRAEIIWQGAKNMIYFKYYLISLSGILFWAIVLKLRPGIQANIVTIATSLVFGLYLTEGGLIFLELDKPRNTKAISAAADMSIDFDQRTKQEVIDDLIAQGIDAVPTIGPRNVLTMDEELLPLGGLSNKTTVAHNENGYFMVYTSDRYGFNNPDSEWNAKQVDWLLTGDSFTEGRAVRPGEDIAGQIRAISHQSTITLGKGGNGPLIELAALTEYIGVANPKKVLWMYYEENDLRIDIQRDEKNPLLMQYMVDGFSQNLIHRQKEIDSRLEEYILRPKAGMRKTKWIRLSKIRKMLSFNNTDTDTDTDVVDIDNPLFAKILTKAKTEVEARGGVLYFVYLPEYNRYSTEGISHDLFRKKAEVIEMVKKLNIQVVDIHQEVFAHHPDPLELFPFRLNGHYNADGYSKVAKAIVTSVNKYK